MSKSAVWFKPVMAVWLSFVTLVIVLAYVGWLAHPPDWVRGQFSIILGGFVVSDIALLATLRISNGKIVFLPHLLNWDVGLTAGGIIFIAIVITASVIADTASSIIQTINNASNAPYWLHYFWYLLAIATILLDFYILARENRPQKEASQST